MNIISINKVESQIIETDERDSYSHAGGNKKYLRLGVDKWYESMGSSYEWMDNDESAELEKLYQESINKL